MLNQPAPEDQYVFTSMRFDSNIKEKKRNVGCCKESIKTAYLLKYHFDRLKDSAGHLGWFDAQKSLKRPVDFYCRIRYAVESHKKETGNRGPFKVRIQLKYHGNLNISVEPIISRHKNPLLFPTTLDIYQNRTSEASETSSIFKTVLDVLPTAKSVQTKNKTENRTTYNYARACAGIQSYQDAKEVLLFNADGEIMDGSITTPYFLRNGKWVTPSNSCGGQLGTTRHWALDQGICGLDIIKADSLRHDEIIWLSNSVKGFFTARFVAHNGRCSPPSYRSSSISSSLTAVETPTSECSPKAML